MATNQSNGRQNSIDVKKKSDKSLQKSRKTTQNYLKRSDSTHPTNAFLKRSEDEFRKLETKLAEELSKQVSALLESENFSDTLLIRGKFNKRVHSCLLLTKIPELFKQILNLNINTNALNSETNEYSVRIPPEIKESELKSLLQQIYSQSSAEDMQREESDLISRLDIYNKTISIEEIIETQNNKESIVRQNIMESDGEFVSHSDNRSDEEQIESEELESYENIDENRDNNELLNTSDAGIMKTSPMVRSGTFELLSSIYSEDNIDLKNLETTEDIDLMAAIEQKPNPIEQNQNQSNELIESIDEKSTQIKDNKTSNSMFQLFIDINETPDVLKNSSEQKQRPQTTRDDKRKGFDFIPLAKTKEKTHPKSGVLLNQRRARNSADAVLIRSLDSYLPNIETIEDMADIPLLPMSPIVKRKPTDFHNKTDARNQYLKSRPSNGANIHCGNSSSDSFSEAFNECMNISVQSSSKNSYESDSIDVFECENECKPNHRLAADSDNESVISDDINDNQDLELNDRNMKSCSKLGEDLLKMFVQQINTDITIRVCDRELRAHKCILTSRSRYFEAMLSGNWIESDTDCVDLQGFTYNSVYFALCHIYSGCLTLPQKIDLSELALLSDVLAMDSLKEIVVHELLVNRCHFFHSPCSDNCIVSVIKCFKLCSRSGLQDLYQKCMQWLAKHYTRVWTNKAFVTLKPELMDDCFRQKVSQLLAENVLKTTLECERLVTAMPRVKWSEPVFALLGKLIEECCHFIADNYDRVITSKDFLALGRGNSWDISNLEQTLLASMTRLSPDVSCKSLIELNKILLLQEEEQTSDGGFSYGPFNDQFSRLVNKMQRYCERYMIQNANRVVHCQCWPLLSAESQQKVRDGAVIVFEFEKPIARPPRLSSSSFRVSDRKSTQQSTEDKTRDKSNSTTTTTKGAVPKNSAKNIRSNTSNTRNSSHLRRTQQQKSSKGVTEQHIYDTVPFENISSNKSKTAAPKRPEKVSNRALSLHLNSAKNEEKIAKVSPFSHKTANDFSLEQNSTPIDINSSDMKDLVAEIDAETNLVTHCLQEAELLEQELTRKIQKTQVKTTGTENRSTTTVVTSSTPSGTQSHQTNSRSTVERHSKDSHLKKMSTKSQSTSSTTHLRSRALPKIPNQRR